MAHALEISADGQRAPATRTTRSVASTGSWASSMHPPVHVAGRSPAPASPPPARSRCPSGGGCGTRAGRPRWRPTRPAHATFPVVASLAQGHAVDNPGAANLDQRASNLRCGREYIVRPTRPTPAGNPPGMPGPLPLDTRRKDATFHARPAPPSAIRSSVWGGGGVFFFFASSWLSRLAASSTSPLSWAIRAALAAAGGWWWPASLNSPVAVTAVPLMCAGQRVTSSPRSLAPAQRRSRPTSTSWLRRCITSTVRALVPASTTRHTSARCGPRRLLTTSA